MPTHLIETPKLALDDAIDLARKHLHSTGQDITTYELVSAEWMKSPTILQWCWQLSWMMEEQFKLRQLQPNMRGGGFLMVLVKADGEVSYSFQR